MSGFFHNLLNTVRLRLCAKQVVASVHTLTPAQGAHLALMTALFRATRLDVQVPGSLVTIGAIVQHPMAYREELCYAAFSRLGDIRQASRDKIKSYASFKILPSPTVKEHTEICDLALSLLMSTVAVGCRPGTLEAVKYAWETVTASSPLADDIAVVMKMPEYIVNDIIEQPLETEKWLELARQSPDFLNLPADHP